MGGSASAGDVDGTSIEGGTDQTRIGNVSDSLKTNVTNAAGASAVNIQDGGNSITVDGTIAATQSGTWNVTNVSGTVSLPTGAATSANQTTQITSLQLLDDVPSGMNAAFSKGNPVMGQLDDTSTTAATEDNVAPVRITPQRALHVNLRKNDGVDFGTSGAPVRVDPTGTTPQPISVATGAGAGVPCFSKKTRMVTTFTPVSITSAATYTTIFTYSGTGYFIGFNAEFNNVAVVVKLAIDGDIVFDGDDLTAYNALVVTANSIDRRQSGSGIVTASAALDWSLRLPIRYDSSVVVSARLTSGAVARTFSQGVFYIVKET